MPPKIEVRFLSDEDLNRINEAFNEYIKTKSFNPAYKAAFRNVWIEAATTEALYIINKP